MTQMTALEHAAQAGVTKQAKPTYGYYRQPNGWITVSPATDLEELKYRREGWEALTRYGRIEMSTEYAADHPLEALFMFGGAHELSVEQIIESALHLNPPLVPRCRQPLNQFHKRHTAPCWQGAEAVSFPQLESPPPGLNCRFCDRVLPTEEARSQHESVMHQKEKAEIRSGEALATSLVQGLRTGGVLNEVPPQANEGKPPTSQPYVCGHCRLGFNHPMRLAKHVKEHKESADGEE